MYFLCSFDGNTAEKVIEKNIYTSFYKKVDS